MPTRRRWFPPIATDLSQPGPHKTRKFGIRFISDPELPAVPGERFGRITVDDFEETFLASTRFWPERRYEEQWREGLLRVTNGLDSCLLTSVGDPAESSGAMMWMLHPDGDEVAVQQRLALPEAMHVTFDPDAPFAHLPPRQQISGRGRISEWRTSMAAIGECLDRMTRRSYE